MIFSILACLRTSLRRHIASMDEGATVAAGSRELQLARSTNRSLAAHPHRSRHPRRTPSQISTVSLPAYMKEPGDQELVVSRGPDAEDLTTPQAPADDDDHTADDTYLAIPPPRAYPHMPRLPTESSLLVGYSTTPDPRGDAPAYFEVVEQHRIGINDYPPNIPPPQRGFLAPIFSSPPPPSPTRAPTPPPSPPRPPRAGTRDRGPGTSGY
ncbi:hypothetical protein C8J57DRAFT_214585 [Mycena rebaudengoi]|nr:hypothetical protein C8J57DRAFT_214585 [Mycena rebaudengoi]